MAARLGPKCVVWLWKERDRLGRTLLGTQLRTQSVVGYLQLQAQAEAALAWGGLYGEDQQREVCSQQAPSPGLPALSQTLLRFRSQHCGCHCGGATSAFN